MATSSGKIEKFIDQVTETKKIYFDELDHLVENSRWLTTLVLAEIGGIAAYRKLIDAKSLSIPFTLIILLLALTIICFMVCILVSRKAKIKISKRIAFDMDEINEINNDGSVAPINGDKQIDELSMALNHVISLEPEDTRSFETGGIILFILSTIATTLVLFFSESLSFFI
jgi:hypothetical protein